MRGRRDDSDAVLAMYSDPEVVALYAASSELQGAERLLFARYVPIGAAVLDVGVGAGRTAAFLAPRAGRYVGVDLSEPMLDQCRRRFPELQFLRVDAADMSVFPAASFDVVVFSFNGIDAAPTIEARWRCLQECARVLRPGGALIFSEHHARYLVYLPVVDGVSVPRAVWRCIYAIVHTASNLLFRLPRPVFWRGQGYVREPFTQHGWLPTFMTTPRRVAQDIRRLGLQLIETVTAQYPRSTWPLATPWYYYACRKPRA
jgi:SAM-dependent methyltransferase